MATAVPDPSVLSRQERRVIAFSMQGLGDKEVAQAMGLALGTVRTYWKRIGLKLGGGTRAEIVSTLARHDAHQELLSERAIVSQLRSEVAARKRTEERFRAICACSPVGLYVSDEDGSFQYVNPAWERTIGRTARAAMGSGWPEIAHPEEAERLAAWWRNSVRCGQPEPIEFRVLTPSGSRCVRSAVAPILLESGTAGYVGTIEAADPPVIPTTLS